MDFSQRGGPGSDEDDFEATPCCGQPSQPQPPIQKPTAAAKASTAKPASAKSAAAKSSAPAAKSSAPAAKAAKTSKSKQPEATTTEILRLARLGCSLDGIAQGLQRGKFTNSAGKCWPYPTSDHGVVSRTLRNESIPIPAAFYEDDDEDDEEANEGDDEEADAIPVVSAVDVAADDDDDAHDHLLVAASDDEDADAMEDADEHLAQLAAEGLLEEDDESDDESEDEDEDPDADRPRADGRAASYARSGKPGAKKGHGISRKSVAFADGCAENGDPQDKCGRGAARSGKAVEYSDQKVFKAQMHGSLSQSQARPCTSSGGLKRAAAAGATQSLALKRAAPQSSSQPAASQAASQAGSGKRKPKLQRPEEAGCAGIKVRLEASHSPMVTVRPRDVLILSRGSTILTTPPLRSGQE